MENGDLIKYCPRCSSNTAVRVENSRKIICSKCGFELYFNTAAAVAAVIFDASGRLLVVRRNREPRKGFLDLPGGFVDFNESGEEALKREVLEELGAEIELVEYDRSIPNTYIYRGAVYHTLDMFFTCRLTNDCSNMRHNDEIAEVLYEFPEEIDESEMAFDSMRRWAAQ